MTKPVITSRVTKGAALTYSELDTNFSNLQNATLSVTDGSNTHAFNLNDTITFTAGTNVTLGVDPTSGAITINSAAGSGVGTGTANYIPYYNSTTTIASDPYLYRTATGLSWGKSADFQFTMGSGYSFYVLGDLRSSSVSTGNIGATGTVITTQHTGNSFFTKVSQTSLNTAFDTSIALDNLNVRIHTISGSSGQLQMSAVSGSFTAYVTTLGNVAGQAVVGDTSSSGITFTAGTWSSCNFRYNMSAGGDVIEAHVADYTNDRIYRITSIHGNNTTAGFISIERLA